MDNKSTNSFKVEDSQDYSDKSKLKDCLTTSFMNLIKYDDGYSVDEIIFSKSNFILKKPELQTKQFSSGNLENKKINSNNNSFMSSGFKTVVKSKFYNKNIINAEKEELMFNKNKDQEMIHLDSPALKKAFLPILEKDKKNSYFNKYALKNTEDKNNFHNNSIEKENCFESSNIEIINKFNSINIREEENFNKNIEIDKKSIFVNNITENYLTKSNDFIKSDQDYFKKKDNNSNSIIQTNFTLKMCKEQVGCRILQNEMISDSKFTSNFLFPNIKNFIVELSVDQFGNYLIQKLIENLKDFQLKEIFNLIINNLILISNNQHGTRVVQKFIDYINDKNQRFYIINKVKSNLVTLVMNIHGCHVVSKIITSFELSDILPLHEYFIINLELFIKNKFGCCIVKKLIEKSDSNQREDLIINILNNFTKYILDPYGNYVIQLAITYDNKVLNSKILDFMKLNFIFYACEKFSSNIIEKALGFCLSETKKEYINMFINKEELTIKLLSNTYGNYILQKIISISNNSEREILIQYLRNSLKVLDTVSFGEKLKSKLISLYPNLKLNNSKILQYPNNMNNFYSFQNTFPHDYVYNSNNTFPYSYLQPLEFNKQSIFNPTQNRQILNSNFFYVPYNNINNFYIQK